MAMTTQTALGADPLPVFVSILPQQYMVEQIGKEKVKVRVMVRPGASPATYEPKPAQMAALSKTALYFSIGVPFETFWMDKITASNPRMTLIRTDRGIPKIPMAAHHRHDEDHGTDEEESGHDHEHNDHDSSRHESSGYDSNGHEHEGLDPHIWTSPMRVKTQADTILAALIDLDPENKTVYTQNHAAFVQKLVALDQDLHELFKDKTGTRFMVFHPSWGYFARDYGLEMIPIEIEGKSPKPAQLKELIQHARENRIQVIFVQPQFSAKSAKLIAREINGQVVKADPLALNWMENMKTMASKFKEVLK